MRYWAAAQIGKFLICTVNYRKSGVNQQPSDYSRDVNIEETKTDLMIQRRQSFPDRIFSQLRDRVHVQFIHQVLPMGFDGFCA